MKMKNVPITIGRRGPMKPRPSDEISDANTASQHASSHDRYGLRLVKCERPGNDQRRADHRGEHDQHVLDPEQRGLPYPRIIIDLIIQGDSTTLNTVRQILDFGASRHSWCRLRKINHLTLPFRLDGRSLRRACHGFCFVSLWPDPRRACCAELERRRRRARLEATVRFVHPGHPNRGACLPTCPRSLTRSSASVRHWHSPDRR